MERQSINQLANGALAELKRQNYAGISIIHFKQAFARIGRYAAETGEVFLSDCLARKYLLDNYGWDMNSKAKPTAHITSQLRAIRILKGYGDNGSIPGRISNTKRLFKISEIR